MAENYPEGDQTEETKTNNSQSRTQTEQKNDPWAPQAAPFTRSKTAREASLHSDEIAGGEKSSMSASRSINKSNNTPATPRSPMTQMLSGAMRGSIMQHTQEAALMRKAQQMQARFVDKLAK